MSQAQNHDVKMTFMHNDFQHCIVCVVESIIIYLILII